LTTDNPPLLTSESDALAAAARFADEVRDEAAERDRAGTYPAQALAAVVDTGLLGIAVPARLGGLEAGPAAIARVLALIAEADPSVAQLLIGHFVVQRVVLGTVPLVNAATRDDILRNALGGARLAILAAERGTAHALQRRTAIVRGPGGGYRLDGTKYYSTGARGARWIAVLGNLDGDAARPGIALLEVDPHDPPAGLTFEDDWDAFGQRGTAR
jgi:alkylation response protein AidB-like acyl-CoA dehydrogenase